MNQGNTVNSCQVKKQFHSGVLHITLTSLKRYKLIRVKRDKTVFHKPGDYSKQTEYRISCNVLRCEGEIVCLIGLFVFNAVSAISHPFYGGK